MQTITGIDKALSHSLCGTAAWQKSNERGECQGQPKENNIVKCWSRSTTIVPAFVGKSLSVYNGQRFVQVKIINYMIGHKLGEFAHTRKAYIHKKQK